MVHGWSGEGLKFNVGGGNLIHRKIVFCICRCLSIWMGISGDYLSSSIFWRDYKFQHKMTRIILRETHALLRLAIAVSPLDSTRGLSRCRVTRIEIRLVIVICMIRVLTNVVSDRLFLNWIGVVRFASHEFWFDQEFAIRHFFHYCVVHIVSLLSLSVGVPIIYTTNELVDRKRIFKSNASQNDQEKNFCAKNVLQARSFLWN